MTKQLLLLLTLLFSLSDPAMGKYSDFGRSSLAAKTTLALPHPKYLFKGDEAVQHFGKHSDSIMNAMGNKSYGLGQYVDDANQIIQNGTWVPGAFGL